MALYEALSLVEGELQRLQRVEHDLSAQVTALENRADSLRSEAAASAASAVALRVQAALFDPARHGLSAARDVARASAASETLREESAACEGAMTSLRQRVAEGSGTAALPAARLALDREVQAAAARCVDSKAAAAAAGRAEGAAAAHLAAAAAAAAEAQARVHAAAQQHARLSDAAAAITAEWHRAAQAGDAAEVEFAAATAAAAAEATEAVAASTRLERARARERL